MSLCASTHDRSRGQGPFAIPRIRPRFQSEERDEPTYEEREEWIAERERTS